MIELTQDFDVHPNQIKPWRDQLFEGATGVSRKHREPSLSRQPT